MDKARAVAQRDPPTRPAVGRLVRRHAGEVLATTTVLAAITVTVAGPDVWLVTALLCLSPVTAAAAVIDARYRRIPTVLTRAGLAVGVAVLGVAAVVTGDGGRLLRTGAAAVAVGLVYLLLWRLASMGLGDVRLAITLGLVAGWAGWLAVVVFVVLAHLLAAPLALWRLARSDRSRVPFGPALVAALYLTVAVPGLAV